uniref:Uncharacterized protein n=1 Tax=Spongospora subterranea TaxID=70186 RepID=A0A0H5RHV2_9EUKA|eukprot:CRZ08259.1 hypothetical protein [Spongospora subterranea]
MIIKRLFDKLFSYGVVFIFTSNRAPNELYKNGIQREQFLSFIDQLCSKCEILNLDSHVDYRKEGVSLSGTFFFPLKEKQEEFFNAFRLLTDNRTPKSKTVAVGQGRDLNIPSTVNGVALFNFEDLCDVALGSADYAAIASNFHTLFLEGVPKFSVESRNVLRRFIVLVDELYQMKVRLICLAACKPEELFRPESKSEAYDEVFAFHRCLSRLIEMQSKEYIVAGDLKRKKRSADKDEI